jgi:zinc-ribbon domain
MSDKETNAFCTQCGAAISSSARFCRNCGAAREPLQAAATSPDTAATFLQPATAAPPLRALPPLPSSPPLPPVVGYPQSQGQRTAASGASILAIAGGIGMLLMVLCAIVYYPLHYHEPLNYGASLKFGDILAFGSAMVAMAIGIRAMRQPAAGSKLAGIVLLAVGVPTLVLTILWAYPETFHLSFYPQPFYFGVVYFTRFGQAHIGSGYLQILLAASSIAIIVAGILMQLGSTRPTQHQW